MKEKKSLHVEMGQRIRNRRKELKWSRETLSEKTDVSARFLTCVENGQSGLSLESLGRSPVHWASLPIFSYLVAELHQFQTT